MFPEDDGRDESCDKERRGVAEAKDARPNEEQLGEGCA